MGDKTNLRQTIQGWKEELARPCDNCHTEGQREALKRYGCDSCPECDGTRHASSVIISREDLLILLKAAEVFSELESVMVRKEQR